VSERKNFPLRIDPELYAALRRWADDELRSVNAQIEFLLTRALREAGRAPRPKDSRSAAERDPKSPG
jgi:hypothetical protein